MKQIVIHLFAFICSVTLAAAQPAPQQAPPRQPGPDSPIVQPDGKVTFNLYAPKAASVSVSGDYPIGNNVPMTKDDKGVWSATVGPLREDFYAYTFTADGSSMLDPRNVHITRDGSRYLNWAVVPGPNSTNYKINDVPHGQVIAVWYPSPTLKLARRRMTVYTPPGYETGQERYPVFYLLHGGGGDEEAWTDMGRAPQIFDNLIAQGKMLPTIVVMGNGNPGQASAPNGIASTPNPAGAAGGRAAGADSISNGLTQYPASIAADMVPFVDKTFRTKADRDHRAIAGLSMGGAQTCETALTNLDKFSWVGLFSSAVPLLPGVLKTIPQPADAATRRGPGLGQTIDPVKFVERYPVVGPGLNKQLHLLYLGVGRSDGLVESDDDIRKMLGEHGVAFVTYDLPGYGHDWNYWRRALQDFSVRLFQPAQSRAGSASPRE
jgi:enterochelin esterase family protein